MKSYQISRCYKGIKWCPKRHLGMKIQRSGAHSHTFTFMYVQPFIMLLVSQCTQQNSNVLMRSFQRSWTSIIVILLTLREDDPLTLKAYIFLVPQIDLCCDYNLWFTKSGHFYSCHHIIVILERGTVLSKAEVSNSSNCFLNCSKTQSLWIFSKVYVLIKVHTWSLGIDLIIYFSQICRNWKCCHTGCKNRTIKLTVHGHQISPWQFFLMETI